VTYLSFQEPDIEVSLIVLRTIWSLDRIKGELTRDGVRLLQKVNKKLIVGESVYDREAQPTIVDLARQVSLPGKNLRDLADQYQIPLLTVKDHNEKKAEEALKSVAPDAIIFTGGGLIRKNILDIPKIGVVNCHSGILPEYRGMDVVEWPILTDPRSLKMGLTLHLMEKGVDTGPILLQRTIEPKAGDSFSSYRTRLEPAMVDIMLEGIRGLRDKIVAYRLQEKTSGKQYFVMHPRIKKAAESALETYQNQAE
jgi:methionyl-tRNA formyltransferase